MSTESNSALSDAKTPLEKIFFIDGVACLGKTTLLKKLKLLGYRCVMVDFTEMQTLYPRLIDKTGNLAIEMEYNHKYWSIINDARKTGEDLVVDRSPVSAAIYASIFDRKKILDSLLWVDYFKKFPNVFFLVPRLEQVEVIAEKMKIRGTDVRQDAGYVKDQIRAFTEIQKNAGINWHVWTPQSELYSPEYFEELELAFTEFVNKTKLLL